MIGLSKISCIALLLFLPVTVAAQDVNEVPAVIHLDEIILDEGVTTMANTIDEVVLGKIEATALVVVTEELPPDPVLVLLEKAKQENAARSNMRTADLTETECLATALYHEARGEGERGIKAVAFVIYNRVKSELFPKSFCEVIIQKAQFSFVSDKRPDSIKDWNIYRRLLAMAVELVDNEGFQRTESPVGNALFFNSFRRRSGWAYARTSKFIATIGNHHFFK